MPKACHKRLYKHIQVVLRKRRLQKTGNNRKMSNTQKIKLPKRCGKCFWKHIKAVLRKKQLIFEKWDHFEKCKKWQQCKCYSPCKILKTMKLPKICEKRLFKIYYSIHNLYNIFEPNHFAIAFHPFIFMEAFKMVSFLKHLAFSEWLFCTELL